jgi:hypothetical protein
LLPPWAADGFIGPFEGLKNEGRFAGGLLLQSSHFSKIPVRIPGKYIIVCMYRPCPLNHNTSLICVTNIVKHG